MREAGREGRTGDRNVEGRENLADVRVASFFFFSQRAPSLCSAFLRSLISPKEISPGETHSHADGTFPPKPLSFLLSLSLCLFLSLSLSFALAPSGHLELSPPFSPLCLPPSLSFSPASLLSYIKQTVSLAALGDIALIFQHSRTGVMQCAAVDTLHEDLSLLK